MCALHSAPSVLECGSCASILSTAALAPLRPVGSGTHALRVNVSELGDSVRACH